MVITQVIYISLLIKFLDSENRFCRSIVIVDDWDRGCVSIHFVYRNWSNYLYRLSKFIKRLLREIDISDTPHR